MAPTTGATIIGGKLVFGGRWFTPSQHHIYPQGKEYSAIAKALGINVQASWNKMQAYQLFGRGHINYNNSIVKEAEAILDQFRAGRIDQATKDRLVRELIEKYRQRVLNDSTLLVRTDKTMKVKSESSGPGSLPGGTGQAAAGGGSGCYSGQRDRGAC